MSGTTTQHQHQRLLLPALLLTLLQQPGSTAATWTKLQFETADGGFDAHGPCPAKVGAVSYPKEDCVSPPVTVGSDVGLFRPPECSASLFGGLSLRGFAQCHSHVVTCWATAGTVFAKLPPECNPGAAATTSWAGGDGGATVADCPGSVVNIAADGSLSLATAQPSGCWNVRLDGVGYKPFGWLFVITVSIAATLYLVGGVAFRVKTQGAAPLLRSHPHVGKWVALRALCEDGLAFARQGGKGSSHKGYTQVVGNAPTRETPASSAERPERPGKERSTKKDKRRDKSEKRQGKYSKSAKQQPDGALEVSTAASVVTKATAAPAAASASASTASGGGGRWVHVIE
jgi:hypothetical protein